MFHLLYVLLSLILYLLHVLLNLMFYLLYVLLSLVYNFKNSKEPKNVF